MAHPTPTGGDGPSEEIVIQGHVDLEGHVYLLNADPHPGGAGWVARVGEYEAQSGAAPVLRQIRDSDSALGELETVSERMTAEGPTADAAIDALEAKLRGAVAEATRPT